MKKLFLGALLGLASLLPFSASAIPLTNLGFESPVVGAGVFTYNAVTPDWTFSGSSGLSGNGSGFTVYNPTAAPEGVQVAFLQSGTGLAAGLISQVFTTTSNSGFGLVFSMANRAIGGSQSINVLLDSALIGSFTAGTLTYFDYTTTSVNLLAGTHTLSFVGLNTVGDNTAFIDNLRIITTVSLPGTITLLLAGIVLIGFNRKWSAGDSGRRFHV